MNRIKAYAARLLIFALVVSTAPINADYEVQAAKKPKLSAKKVTIEKGRKKKVTVKNAKKYKVSWKIKSKKIATFKKNGKYGVKLTAKKVGNTKLVCTLKKGKKKKTLKCSVQVKEKRYGTVPTQEPTATPKPTLAATPVPTEPSMKGAYKGLIDNIGTCINYNAAGGQMQNADIMEFVDKHFNSITMENEMKPDAVLRSTLITKEEAQKLGYCLDGYEEEKVPRLNLETVFNAMKKAKEHGLRVRAHTLVWHSQTPEWFFREGYKSSGAYVDVETMNARLEFYVRTMISQVCAKEKELTGEVGSIVYAWDVVNEYIHRSSGNWMGVYGNMRLEPSYVKDAFRYAYDELKKAGAENKVSLIFNDYDTYFNVEDEIAVVNFINEGEEAKICSGIGMQSHVDIKRPTIEEYKTALQAFLNAGLEVQITELDITINFDSDTPTWNYRDEGETDEEQAAFTKDFMKMIIDVQRSRNTNVSPKGITGITVWGLYDEISWRSARNPLFFKGTSTTDPVTGETRYDIQPKGSFYSFIEAPGK